MPGLFRTFLFLLALILPLTGLAATGQAVPLAVLIDANGQESIDSISSPARINDFRDLRHGFSGGYTRKVHWFRFTLQAPAADDGSSGPLVSWLEIHPSYLDDIRLYQPDPHRPGQFTEQRAGDTLPFSSREIPYRSFVLPVEFPDQQPLTLYLRLETSSSSLLILRQWSPADFHASEAGEYGLLGIYYGVVLTIFIINLWQGLWRSIPLHRAYLFYVGSGLLLVFSLNGFAAQYLLPEQPWLSNLGPSLGTLLTGVSGALFYRLVLDIDRRTPLLNLIYRSVQWFSIICLPTPFFDLYTEIATPLVYGLLLISVTGMFRSVQLWHRGLPGGYLLITAHTTVLLGSLSVTLTLLGILPGDFWMINGFQIGSLFTILSLALVLVQRVRAIDQENRLSRERIQLAEMRGAQERLARREQSRFIATLSHEVRTPLAIIDGAAQSLGYLLNSDDPNVLRRLERIRRGVSRMGALTEQFLDKDRVDDETLTIRPVPMDASILCQETVAQLDAEHRILTRIQGTTRLQADPLLLQVALRNLLNNALKYASPASHVHLELQGDDTRLRFTVRNRGPAIPPEMRDAIFDSYVRGPQDDSVPGAGLGLYLVRRIAELHGGSVRLETGEDDEIAFTLEIPVPPREPEQ